MMKPGPCALYGLCGLLLAVLGQFLTVQFNHQGDRTALFYTGQQTVIPDSLGERLYRAPDDEGFDGQFYHLIAHDPFLGKGYSASIDNPRLRWRRILVPLAAFLLALGQSGWIDTALFAVTAAFVFLGVYWLARLAQTRKLHPACGLLFLTLPAVFISLERMTVDVALAALAVGFVVYAPSPGWKFFVVLAAAPLARETGLILVAAYGLQALLRRSWRELAWSIGCVLPFVSWMAFVHAHAPPDATAWAASFPFSGLLRRTIDPFPFEVTGLWVGAAAVTDYLGIIGIWIGIAAALILARSKPVDAVTLAGLGFVALAGALGKADVWQQAYGFSRIFSPWFVWLAAAGLQRNSQWMLAPWALNVPRFVVQAWVHLPGILKAALSR
jgi:hypothetical protein